MFTQALQVSHIRALWDAPSGPLPLVLPNLEIATMLVGPCYHRFISLVFDCHGNGRYFFGSGFFCSTLCMWIHRAVACSSSVFFSLPCNISLCDYSTIYIACWWMFGSLPVVVSFMYKAVRHNFKGIGRSGEEMWRALTSIQALTVLSNKKKWLNPHISLPKAHRLVVGERWANSQYSRTNGRGDQWGQGKSGACGKSTGGQGGLPRGGDSWVESWKVGKSSWNDKGLGGAEHGIQSG